MAKPNHWRLTAEITGTGKTPKDFARENSRYDRLHGGKRYLVKTGDGLWKAVSKDEFDAAERRILERTVTRKQAVETPGVKTTPNHGGKFQKFAYRSCNADDITIYEDDHNLPRLTNGSFKQVEYASSFRPDLIDQVMKHIDVWNFDYELGRRIRVEVRGITDCTWYLARRDRSAVEIVEELSSRVASTGIIIPEVQAPATCKSDELICGMV